MSGNPTTFCVEHYPDDPNVLDNTNLFRRIHPDQVVFDDNLKCHRPSSQAFRDDRDKDPMSVYLSSVLAAESRDPSVLLIGHARFSLAAITAGFARLLSQTVHPEPEPDETSHAVVCGDKESKNRKSARALAKAAIWVVVPPSGGK
jgi:hypothetical protein